MPIFVAALLGGLAQVAGSLVGRVLIALGISYVSYQGVDSLLSWAMAEVLTRLNGLPSAFIGVLGVLKVGTCLSIISSAFAARLTLSGLTSGAITRQVIK